MPGPFALGMVCPQLDMKVTEMALVGINQPGIEEVSAVALSRAAEGAACVGGGSAGLRKACSLEVKVRALPAERRQRVGYERQQVAANTACNFFYRRGGASSASAEFVCGNWCDACAHDVGRVFEVSESGLPEEGQLP